MARKNQQRALRQAAERAAKEQSAQNIASTIIVSTQPQASPTQGEERNTAAAAETPDITSKTYTAV